MSAQRQPAIDTENPAPAKASYKTEADMLLALRDHFAAPEYVLLPQVRNGAGFEATRTVDALAMSVWPSRGLSLYGIEIKVSRGDWMREKRNPKKADEIASYCDYWVLAAGGVNVVQEGELPQTWGLLVPGKKPGALRMKVPPTKLEATPLSRSFLAAILRKTAETVVPLAAVDAEIERRVQEQTASLEQRITERLTHDLGSDEKKYADLKASVDAFAQASGLDLRHCTRRSMKRLGRALALLEWDGLDEWLDGATARVGELHKDLMNLKDALPTPQQTDTEESAA